MIEGSTINLRALETNDLKILKDWRNDKKNRIHTREFRLLNMINQKKWFESIHLDNPPKFMMFGIVTKKQKLIGVCGLTYIDWKNRHAEISIIIFKNKWQKLSETKEVIKLLTNYAFDEMNMHRLWVEIFDTIPDSIKLFESMKFIKEGTLRQKLWRNGKWWDSQIYSKLISNKRK